ncbi:UDP-glucose 4-epimerase [Sinosporangium album]|uniref:UDP-glucose 4-epimerase n=1 Tax=Sinosporangium album TaxID=504805 RepID=A0A1G7U7N5_9ACTN|nr:NAD-dependent epimerase/dehydratase family protein [Sinosporangium album]SDG43602.1 UDP-glucose 4-epimerase [Sinosporangium album]
MTHTVLVTGVSRHIGARVAGVLASDPDVASVIGVDTAPPWSQGRSYDPSGRAQFVRVDLRSSDIADVMSVADIDTVVHLSLVSAPSRSAGRDSMKEHNIIGTMQLLAACQRSATVRRVVVRSTTAVYGSSSHDPAVFTEDLEAADTPNHGYGKDAIEVEGYVRGFARRRPDIPVSLLRFAPLMGPTVSSPLTRFFVKPVLPTVLGFDPRLQFVHEDDAVEVLRRMAVEDHPGTFNVAGDGVLTMSQCVRRTGRLTVPLPSPAFRVLGEAVRRAGILEYSPEQLSLLSHGRAVDTARLAHELGWKPKFTTAAAFDDFLRAHGMPGGLPVALVDAVAELVRPRGDTGGE